MDREKRVLLDIREKVVHLFPDVSFLETTEGIKIYNNNGYFYLKGIKNCSIISWLIDKLDGRQRVKNFLPKGHPAEQILLIIKVLLKYNFARILPFSDTKKQVLLEKYAEINNFLEYYVEDPIKTLEQFRLLNFICVGGGICQMNLILTLLESGAINFIILSPKQEHDKLKLMLDSFKRLDKNVKYKIFSVEEKKYDASAFMINHSIILLAHDIPYLFLTNFIEKHDFLFSYKTEAVILPENNKIYAITNFQKNLLCYKCLAHDFLRNQYNIFRGCPVGAGISAQYIVLSLLCNAAGISKKLASNLLVINQENLTVEKKRYQIQCECRK